MTGEMFKAYTEQLLAPTLTRGDIVFMDNVSVHKVDGIEEAIEARGAIPFYLPAYGPDLNPIEQLFAKLKALLRKIASYTLKNSAFTVRSLCKTTIFNVEHEPECRATSRTHLPHDGGPQRRDAIALGCARLQRRLGVKSSPRGFTLTCWQTWSAPGSRA
jgi:transposase